MVHCCDLKPTTGCIGLGPLVQAKVSHCLWFPMHYLVEATKLSVFGSCLCCRTKVGCHLYWDYSATGYPEACHHLQALYKAQPLKQPQAVSWARPVSVISVERVVFTRLIQIQIWPCGKSALQRNDVSVPPALSLKPHNSIFLCVSGTFRAPSSLCHSPG